MKKLNRTAKKVQLNKNIRPKPGKQIQWDTGKSKKQTKQNKKRIKQEKSTRIKQSRRPVVKMEPLRWPSGR